MLRNPAKSFEDLVVWQKAHGFTLQVYAATRSFPKDELFGLTSQFRRAAVSVPANVAEGFRKRSEADKARYLNISEGSLDECRYYLILANDLGYQKNRRSGNQATKSPGCLMVIAQRFSRRRRRRGGRIQNLESREEFRIQNLAFRM